MELSSGQVISALQNIDEYEFEHFVADLWARQGWTTTVTQGSADRGIDVVAEKKSPFHQKQVIQAKRYSSGNKVGSPEIQQYSSLRHQENDVDAVVVVTTSSFTQQAEEIASDLNIKTVTGNQIYDLLSNLHAEDLLKEYVDTESDDQVQTSETVSASPNPSDSSRRTTSQAQNHPFDEENNPKQVNSNQTHFEKCPECLSEEVWFAKIDGVRRLKCANCLSAWKKTTKEERGWIFTKEIQGWEEYEGPNKGILKSKKEWTS